MLPPFDEFGNLPAGIHPCTMEELAERFGQGSPERVVEIAELIAFIHAARETGIQRIIVNGSFVTAKEAPNDVDVIVLPGSEYPRGKPGIQVDEVAWPFLQIIVAADEADLLAWSHDDFGTDRKGRSKGVVEVLR